MGIGNFKVILLTHGGAERLLGRLTALRNIDVVGVLVETKTERQRPLAEKIRRSVKYDGLFATVKKTASIVLKRRTPGDGVLGEIASRQDQLRSFAERSGIPLFKVDNFHSETARRAMEDLKPDLGILYGTNIIRESVFNIPRLGSINLHQGMAPYYRGGPTVFWELYNGETEIGITVHYVAAKVDTGDIVLQTSIPLNYDFGKYGLNYEDFIVDFRKTLREPSIEMISRSVELISTGLAVPRIQDITLGKRYRLPTSAEKKEVRRILRARMNMPK